MALPPEPINSRSRGSEPGPEPARLASAAFWSASDLGLRHGVPLLVGMLLARLLTPYDFGLVALLVAFSSLGYALIDGGFGVALVRMRRSTPDEETTALAINLSASLMLAVALIAAGPTLALAFGSPELRDLVYPAAAVLPLSAVSIVPSSLLSRELDFRTQALCAGAASGIAGAAAVIMALSGFGVWSLALQLPIAAALRSLLLLRSRGWLPTGRLKMEAARSLFRFGAWLQAATVVDVLFQRLQTVLVGRIFGPSTLGQFAQAQNLQGSANALLGGVLARVGLPALAALQNDPPAFSRGLQSASAAAMLLNIPGVVIISQLSREVVLVLFGPQWGAAGAILSILALSGVLWPLQVINLTALNAVGRSDLFFRAELAKKIPGLLLIATVAPFGVVPLAWSVVAVSLYAYFVNAWWAGKLFGIGALAQLRSVTPILLCGIAMAVSMMLAGWHMAPSVARAALMIAVGIAVYFAGLWLARPPAVSVLLAALPGGRRQRSLSDL